MQLFNDGWEFSKQPLHTDLEVINQRREAFLPVGLPHDWLIYDTEHFYEDGTGWYRKTFYWKPEENQRVFLRFDGIYMDSTVYVNDRKAGEWKYGYSAFEIEMTSCLKEGENEIKVSVDYQNPNSRWYPGAGIYRDVWIKTVHQCHLVSDGIYFHAQEIGQNRWKVSIETEVEGTDCQLIYEIAQADTDEWRILSGKETAERVCLQENDSVRFLFETIIDHPKVWDVGHPDCYRLKVSLEYHNRILQTEELTIGFRTIHFSPEQGFLLNGRKLKLNGVCEHHDLGCLGAAYHPQAMRRKFRILRDMGVNAVRLSHNMPSRDVMELADEMGILIVSEAFDMWESSKNTYDYARFFTRWYAKDVASWIRRDRNHPSLIMWSIGNEIYDTHVSERGCAWTRILTDEVKKYDSRGNGAVTIGSNYMPWENARKCADIVKLAGYNYGDKYYELHHQEHPDWIIYGSETGSTVQSRGIYHFPYQQSVLADVDEQCSALGNSTTSWGARSTEACIIAERDHPFSCGQFVWTGFDYIGEPTPYHTRNSYFGQADTAGFPKDSYYIFQAEWTDYRKNPMVHIFPYWDFNEEQLIDIRVCSNAPVVELFLNGKSQGSCFIDHKRGEQLVGHWQLPYAKGEIKAIACDEDGTVVAREVRHSFGEAARICLDTDISHLKADGQELLFLEISMRDKEGYQVENANNRIHIRVEGAGSLVGMDNGDSTESDGYKSYSRKLFSGKLLAVCKADTVPGELKITVESPGLPSAYLHVPVIAGKATKGSSPLAYLAGPDIGEENQEIPVRNIRLLSSNGIHLYEGNKSTEVTAAICPENATDRELVWGVVDDAGIPSKIASVEAHGGNAKVTAKSDGQFRLRCMSRCGTDKIRIISQLEFVITGLGKAFHNPYEFVTGGLYDYSKGEIGNGNDHGVATARDGESQVGFHDIDFGSYGSDEIILPIFALTDEPYKIKIYEGMPGEPEASLIGDCMYQKPSVWNVYQEETYHLKKRLSGVTSLCFVVEKKIHLKGFRFMKITRAWQKLPASECDHIYGDSYFREKDRIKKIGNNVTIEFEQMDFGREGTGSITICGSTLLEVNTIIVRFVSEGAEERQMLQFRHGHTEQTFPLKRVYGVKTVSFVFLPGSSFDFSWLKFQK
ncbi:glycoside hydrolase family 2 TIM barrel-domain containing protein [Novisyntrophococcus fermenticellae]|uniref:glycoside hydrolase family 2 TIM barrel-domain containing protein n=1 Tax=Novisyntrophococcus fermenticellae TaxID=2068655 RepID=UPI001E631A8F|nr:glycoside hydrolase family 2 TIM barrel-domain containing protein [Novisyntrophococcus fermenticellae]